MVFHIVDNTQCVLGGHKVNDVLVLMNDWTLDIHDMILELILLKAYYFPKNV